VRFVLVHGAWLGGWTWERLRLELESRGHEAVAPDLPCDTVGLTQDDYAALIGPQPDAVVVGHSLGGLTASLVEAPLRAYLAPILPLEGAYDRFLRPGFGGIRRDAQGRSYWPDLETTASRLMPDCDRRTAEWAFERLRPQAPLDTHGGALSPDDVVIACARDVAIDPASFAGLPLRVAELDAGHFPMLTHPRELADALEELALVRAAGEADERRRGDP
jgi:pimeloyl-ACP methyl ester carboxylesterase